MASAVSKFASVKETQKEIWSLALTQRESRDCKCVDCKKKKEEKTYKEWKLLLYSQVSLNGHLYNKDTLLKRTPFFTPCNELTLHKMDISLKWTPTAGPKGAKAKSGDPGVGSRGSGPPLSDLTLVWNWNFYIDRIVCHF